MEEDTVKTQAATTTRGKWLRIVFMVLFGVVYTIVEMVILAIAVFQALSTLFTNEQNARLLPLGDSLSTYVCQIMRYLTYNSEELPFPFQDWPEPRQLTDTRQAAKPPTKSV